MKTGCSSCRDNENQSGVWAPKPKGCLSIGFVAAENRGKFEVDPALAYIEFQTESDLSRTRVQSKLAQLFLRAAFWIRKKRRALLGFARLSDFLSFPSTPQVLASMTTMTTIAESPSLVNLRSPSPSASGVVYTDGVVTLTRSEITIHGYYFPLGKSKTIRFEKIKKVTLRKLGWFSGKLRIWGSSLMDFRWYARDCGRSKKTYCIDIDVAGSWITCSVSPQNVRRVYDLLAQQVPEAVDRVTERAADKYKRKSKDNQLNHMRL